MVELRLHLVLLLALEEILAQQDNTTSTTPSITVTAVDIGAHAQLPARRQLENGLEIVIDARRKFDRPKNKKNDRSTSSSSGSKEKKDSQRDKASSEDDSLNMSEELSTSSGDNKGKKATKYERKSSAERKGWRKWHRKCVPCPEDMGKKWKDQSIKWICGAYQRAQRSFKSLCMMHYRNCQDGTMFTKIHDHRCLDDNEREGRPHGDHFFYTYNVVMSGDSSASVSSSKMSTDTGSSLFNYHEY